jgi:hypothetical protein
MENATWMSSMKSGSSWIAFIHEWQTKIMINKFHPLQMKRSTYADGFQHGKPIKLDEWSTTVWRILML